MCVACFFISLAMNDGEVTELSGQISKAFCIDYT